MKLLDALKIARQAPPPDARPLRVFLACGFTPLHLETFLAAHLRHAAGDEGERAVEIHTGLYGDCLGSVTRLAETTELDTAAIVLEWSDFDPRLGLRQLGGWGVGALADVLVTARQRIKAFEAAIARAAQSVPLAVCLPTLPLPPISHLPGWQRGEDEFLLHAALCEFGARLAAQTRVRVVNAARLARFSPPGERWDAHADLQAGFPYKLPHASTVAEMLAGLMAPRRAKKGLITDLDDTLWSGLVGEVGAGGVHWGLEQNSQTHALYQQMLSALAETGVLIAIASRNDPALVQDALRREDLLPRAEHIFPVDISWESKSQAVGRILRAWNIGPQDVVFVDDSPLELAEVQAAFPDIECLQFNGQDGQATLDLLWRLRDLFGKDTLAAEDALRLASLRHGATLASHLDAAQSGEHTEHLLAGLEAELTFDFARDPAGGRALELINKTNQFNLNGRRLDEAAWLRLLRAPNAFVATVSYRDKFGPLGKIAVLAGHVHGYTLHIEHWVMSCRAFARRIEQRCLQVMFEMFNADEIVFDCAPTPKNGPLREFLEPLREAETWRVTHARFAAHCPQLHHRVVIQEPSIESDN